jgi:hypothetical protein
VSRPGTPEPVKLVMSLLSGDRGLVRSVIGELALEAGPPDLISENLPFAYTDYYSEEMGPSLERRLVSFESLVMPDRLPEIKLRTNGLEERSARDGKRRINIDPGYLSAFHLILATGKGYAHRPYLREGIYADLTLLYRDGAFHALEWTYPDYREKGIQLLLMAVRKKYMLQRRAASRKKPEAEGNGAGGNAGVVPGSGGGKENREGVKE